MDEGVLISTEVGQLLRGIGNSTTRANAIDWLQMHRIHSVEALREVPGLSDQFMDALHMRRDTIGARIVRKRLDKTHTSPRYTANAPLDAVTDFLIQRMLRGSSVWKETKLSHGDPRLQPTCLDFFGSHKSWNTFRVVEDYVSQRPATQVSNRSLNIKCTPGSRYQIFPKRPPKGYSFACKEENWRSLPKGSCSTLAMLIPKCGSTSLRQVLRYWLKHHTTLRAREVPVAELTPRLSGSFVVVREPLTRLLSAYGTIVERASRLPAYLAFRLYPFIRHADEVARFSHFAQLLRYEGDRLMMREAQEVTLCERDPIWMHAMSQMFYFQAYPHAFDYVAHLETYDADLREIERTFTFGSIFTDESERQKQGNNKTMRSNARQGRTQINMTQLMLMAPQAVQDLVHYARHDYACLTDYIPKMSGPHAAFARDPSRW